MSVPQAGWWGRMTPEEQAQFIDDIVGQAPRPWEDFMPNTPNRVRSWSQWPQYPPEIDWPRLAIALCFAIGGSGFVWLFWQVVT